MRRARTRTLAYALFLSLALHARAWTNPVFDGVPDAGGVPGVAGGARSPFILDSRSLHSAYDSARVLSHRLANFKDRHPAILAHIEAAQEAALSLERSLNAADALWSSEQATDIERTKVLYTVRKALSDWETASQSEDVRRAVSDPPEAPVALGEVLKPLQELHSTIRSGSLAKQAVAAGKVFSESGNEEFPVTVVPPVYNTGEAASRLRLAAASQPTVELKDFTARLVPDNEQALAENLDMLEHAVSRAGIATFQWHNDDAGRAVAWAAIDAARRGVDVGVYVDSLQIRPRDRALLATMAGEGVKVRHFRPPGLALLQMHKRLHDKAVWTDTADGRVQVLLGGRNKGDYYLHGTDVFDVDVRLTVDRASGEKIWRRQFEVFRRVPSAAVWEFKSWRRFRHRTWLATLKASYDKVRAKPPEDPGLPEVAVGWGAFARNGGRRATATRLIEAVLASAKERVVIANAYFIPSKRVRRLLHDLLASGVQVEVYSNSATSTPHTNVIPLMRRAALRLRRAGMSLFTRLRGELHAKAATADGRFLAIGSTNLDPRSEKFDSQNGVVLDSPELARQFETVIGEQVLRRHYQLDRDSKGLLARAWQAVLAYFEDHF